MKTDNMKNILQGMNMAKLMEDDDIRTKIVIREEFKSLIPPLSVEELEQLEENILEEGVRDPVILWELDGKFILVDGHNRFAICQKHNLQFPFKKVSFKDDEEVQAWMVKNQLGRRNLSNEQQSYLRGLRYHQEKQQGRRADLTSSQNEPKLHTEQTADRLAEEYNVSRNTIKRDAQFAAGVELIGKENAEIKKEILQGKAKLKKQDIQDVGRNKKSVNDLFHVDQNEVKKKKQRITPESIAEIAFSFINEEKRSIAQVMDSISSEELSPLNFFMLWNERKPN
ncbi:MAG: ParB N-terminal domain-containing protein [Cyclobacteriaceae bacterium]